jgi:hypothetical protein
MLKRFMKAWQSRLAGEMRLRSVMVRKVPRAPATVEQRLALAGAAAGQPGRRQALRVERSEQKRLKRQSRRAAKRGVIAGKSGEHKGAQ